MEAAALANGEDPSHPVGSLRWNAQQLLRSGQVPAIKETADRLDGRVAQPFAGPDGEGAVEVIHRIERVIVDPKNIE